MSEKEVVGPITLDDWRLMLTLRKSIPWLEKQDSRVFCQTLEMERRIYKELKEQYTKAA